MTAKSAPRNAQANISHLRSYAPPPPVTTGEQELRAEVERLRLENRMLRKALAPLPEADRPLPELPPLQRLTRHLVDPIKRALTSRPVLDWNAPEDRDHAHLDSGFERVLHVFNRQWIGIRAAAGSLPGHKLAVDGKLPLGAPDVRAVARGLSDHGIERIVFHGMSGNLHKLIGQLAAAGLSRRMYLVYHGSVAQWCDAPERKLAFMALDAATRGQVHRIHVMKSGHDFVPGRSFTPLLLNMAPVPGIGPRQDDGDVADILLPGTDAWCKNTHGSALGAAMTPGVDRVIHLMKGLELPQPFGVKLRHVAFVDRRSTFRLMAGSAATIYASLVECHPMVNLESEAVGTACIRNRLDLDVLEDHPYVRLVEVPDRASPRAISETLQKVLAVSTLERRDLIRDYLARLNSVALARYRDFLEL